MAICLRNITLTYDSHPAVHHLTATIPDGALLAIVGPNGAGKSTLLNALAGLTPVSEGDIEGLNPRDVAYLPQQSALDKGFPISVAELVATGLWQQSGFGSSMTGAQYRECEAATDAVGLTGFGRRMINTLSGGQLQRALFARVLLQNQPIILLDEPFNAIDARTVEDLTQVIKLWHEGKRTVVMVTHDLEHVRQHCPQTLLLARECLAFGETAKVLTVDNLRRARQMCETFDVQARWCDMDAA